MSESQTPLMTSKKTAVEELVRLRRNLHQIPELVFDIPKTLDFVEAELTRLNDQHSLFEITHPARSALCAYVNLGKPTTLAVRTDMDALPIAEATQLPFASTHPGQMHACGHDGHMSMVLGLARWLTEQAHLEELLPQNVLLVFQPAEETEGGARLIATSGIFERYNVTGIVGTHLWPDLPKGQISTRPGALLAAAHEITITVHGRASHIAKAEQGRDALLAATHTLHAVYQEIEALAAAGADPCLIKFGHMYAGTVRNQIANTAVLEGTLRTFSKHDESACREALARVCATVPAEFGCTAELHISDGYPPVVNDPALTARVMEVLDAQKTIDGAHELDHALMIAEDFAWYQQYIPGCFMLLGTGRPTTPLHANTFDFDESILYEGFKAYCALVQATF